VTEEVMAVLPNTLLLTLAAAIVALILGVPTGILSACERNTRMDITARSPVLIGISLPGFVIALILIIVFSVYLEWFPTSGFGKLKHIVLPGVSLGVFTAAIMARITRSSMVDVILQDYILS
jgi:ABC-type dipeptide/oligopeptide/nickel transport system permease component